MADEKMKLDSDFRDGKTSNKKGLIIGAIIVILVSIITTVISIGLWIGMRETVLKEKMALTDDLYQETDVYTKSKIYVMTTKLNNIDTTIIQDFNTYLDVMKTNVGGYDYCFLSILNDTQTFRSEGLNLVNKKMDKSNFTNIYYETVGGKLSDISFLNKQAYYLCKGLETYWVAEKCAPSVTAQRAKRGAYGGYGCNSLGYGYGNNYGYGYNKYAYNNGYYNGYNNGYFSGCVGCYGYFQKGSCRDLSFYNNINHYG